MRAFPFTIMSRVVYNLLLVLIIAGPLNVIPAQSLATDINVVLTEIEGGELLSDYNLIGAVIADGLEKDLGCILIYGRDLRSSLEQNNFNLDGCNNANCLGELGRLLNAQLIISGEISINRGKYHFNLSVFNTSSLKIVSSKHFNGPASRVDSEIGWKLEDEIKSLIRKNYDLTNVKVETRPSKAMVTVNGEYIGTSPLKLDNLRQGFQYQFAVEKTGFKPHLQTYTFKKNNEKLNIRLSELGETLSFSGYPTDSKVFVNQDYIGLLHNLKYDGVAKKYNIKVKKPGYRPYKETVRLKNGEAQEIRVFLKKRSKIPPLLTSAVIPGSGQFLHGRWLRGLVLLSATAGVGYLTYLEYLVYDDRYQAYSVALDQYNNQRDLNLIESDMYNVQTRFDDMKNHEQYLLQYMSALGTIWTINLFEIILD